MYLDIFGCALCVCVSLSLSLPLSFPEKVRWYIRSLLQVPAPADLGRSKLWCRTVASSNYRTQWSSLTEPSRNVAAESDAQSRGKSASFASWKPMRICVQTLDTARSSWAFRVQKWLLWQRELCSIYTYPHLAHSIQCAHSIIAGAEQVIATVLWRSGDELYRWAPPTGALTHRNYLPRVILEGQWWSYL